MIILSEANEQALHFIDVIYKSLLRGKRNEQLFEKAIISLSSKESKMLAFHISL